ncbi:kinase-like domain-containing protein [Mycena amicta]|nr:kinase-like domain-containing protein [Mycena amicta]
MEDVSMQSSSQWNNPHEDPDASQSTQAISQELVEDNNGCWGLLVPADATSGDRIRLHKSKLNFTVGRDIESDLTLESKYISAKHAAITWNGREGELSTVVLYDYSRNGTYLIEEKVGRDKTRILNDGQQVVFGPMNLRRSEKDPAPSKYMFRDLVHVKRPIDADYDMQMKIGSGNFASVYKALEKRTGKWVAVKVIDHVKRFAGTAKGLSGALSEIQLLQKLHHTNVVKLFTYFDNPDFSLDIVFELVEGGNLESFIRRYEGGNGLSEWMACHMSDQICCATAFIHSQGITHRDLKPDNILLTTHEPPIVKVADFGVAKLVDQQSGLKTICGTIHYMAPEIVQRESADPPYTNLVDSWSVGAMIFCMYTGYPPWNISGNDMNQLRGLMATSGLLGIRWDLLEQNKLISSNGTHTGVQVDLFNPIYDPRSKRLH